MRVRHRDKTWKFKNKICNPDKSKEKSLGDT